MIVDSFSELRQFIRRYNSVSVLDIGARECWGEWSKKRTNPIDWNRGNTKRNYAVRLMLLASTGNSYRRGEIVPQKFDELINAYYGYDGHTISNGQLLEDEASIISASLVAWEETSKNETYVRNCSSKLSDILNLQLIRSYAAVLFLQRGTAFQNAGFGKPSARITRTIKFIELLDNLSSNEFSKAFLEKVGLQPVSYCKHFMPCLSIFMLQKEKQGFYNTSQLSNLHKSVQDMGLSADSLKKFIRQNSRSFSTNSPDSFRSRVINSLEGVSDFYQPFFRNCFLDRPIIKLKSENFCLPDPFSFTESCWNQVSELGYAGKGKGNLISGAFEDYLEKVLFPQACSGLFKKIPPVNNGKRADFLIRTPSAYIVVECKNSIMSAETSAYFQASKIADLWYRIHLASDQIGKTVKALNLTDKPVVPLILTLYEGIAAAEMFRELTKQTDYCSRMGLEMPPVVSSLHEFEHWTHDRSISNWAELELKKGKGRGTSVPADGGGHRYAHLKDISIV